VSGFSRTVTAAEFMLEADINTLMADTRMELEAWIR
jgi:hypothetical protein